MDPMRLSDWSGESDPARIEGEGLGSNLPNLYAAALGTYKALTVLWHAKCEGIPLE